MKNTKQIIIAATLLASFATQANTFKTHGVEFPQGAISFADKVVSYHPGSGVAAPHDVASMAIGIPGNAGGFCNTNKCDEVSLGIKGTITVEFTDNYLTTSGDNKLDLWIFETGGAVEATKIDVSVNGTDWVDVGHVAGATAGIDLDAYIGKGIVEDTKYRFVKMQDMKAGSAYPMQGADIDAVGAISAATTEVRKFIKEIQTAEYKGLNILFGDNDWLIEDKKAIAGLNKLGEAITSPAFAKGVFTIIGHSAGTSSETRVCIDEEHNYITDYKELQSASDCWTSKEFAQVVSDNRAKAVAKYLNDNFSVPVGRIKAFGMSDKEQSFRPDSHSGNRRVEVKYVQHN